MKCGETKSITRYWNDKTQSEIDGLLTIAQSQSLVHPFRISLKVTGCHEVFSGAIPTVPRCPMTVPMTTTTTTTRPEGRDFSRNRGMGAVERHESRQSNDENDNEYVEKPISNLEATEEPGRKGRKASKRKRDRSFVKTWDSRRDLWAQEKSSMKEEICNGWFSPRR